MIKHSAFNIIRTSSFKLLNGNNFIKTKKNEFLKVYKNENACFVVMTVKTSFIKKKLKSKNHVIMDEY